MYYACIIVYAYIYIVKYIIIHNIYIYIINYIYIYPCTSKHSKDIKDEVELELFDSNDFRAVNIVFSVKDDVFISACMGHTQQHLVFTYPNLRPEVYISEFSAVWAYVSL